MVGRIDTTVNPSADHSYAGLGMESINFQGQAGLVYPDTPFPIGFRSPTAGRFAGSQSLGLVSLFGAP